MEVDARLADALAALDTEGGAIAAHVKNRIDALSRLLLVAYERGYEDGRKPEQETAAPDDDQLTITDAP